MKKRIVCVFLALLMLLSCFGAGLSALAADDAELQQIADFLDKAVQDSAEDDRNFDNAIAMLAELSSDELIAVGKHGGAKEGEEFWWAGDRLLHIHRNFRPNAYTDELRGFCPSVFLEIAQRVPAYADFVGVLLDGITVYSLLIGEPTAEISLSETERTPFAIGKRMAQLPEGQAASLKSEIYFGSSDYFSIEGITENIDEEKAKDVSIGALYSETEFFGFIIPNWTTVACGSSALENLYLAATYFEKTFTEAEPGLAALENFSNVIEGLHEPYRAKDVEAARSAYAAVPTTAWSLADERASAAREKYRTILSAAGLEDNDVDLSVYKVTELGSSELSQKTADEIWDFFDEQVDSNAKLGAAIASLATGRHLVSLLGKLAELNEILAGALTISFVQSNLQKDPKFAGAVQTMQAIQDEGHTDGFVEYGIDEEGFRIVAWSAADRFTSADFGFADGDYYGFADALGASLSGFSAVLSFVSGFSFKNTRDGDNYIIGKYEDMIELFELLDLPTPSSADFTAAEESAVFTDAQGNAYTDPVRAGVNELLRPITEFLMTTFRAAPMDALHELLPKVAYAIESGLLNATLQKLIGSFSALGFSAEVNKDTFWNLLDRKLISGWDETSVDGTKTRHIDGGIDFEGNGKKEPFPIKKAQFDALVSDLAGCAQPVVKPSVSIPHANRLGLNTQPNKVLSVLLCAILEMAKTSEGQSFAEKLFDLLGAPSFANKLLNFAAKRGVGFTFKLLDRFLPIITIVLAVLTFFKKVKALFGR